MAGLEESAPHSVEHGDPPEELCGQLGHPRKVTPWTRAPVPGYREAVASRRAPVRSRPTNTRARQGGGRARNVDALKARANRDALAPSILIRDHQVAQLRQRRPWLGHARGIDVPRRVVRLRRTRSPPGQGEAELLRLRANSLARGIDKSMGLEGTHGRTSGSGHEDHVRLASRMPCAGAPNRIQIGRLQRQ